jgi:hypothetical protein
MSELALNIGISNGAKEYAIRKPQVAPNPQEEALIAGKQGVRESGFEWNDNGRAEYTIASKIDDAEMLLTSSATDVTARVIQSGTISAELSQELHGKFKKLFVSAYANVFSHNRLLAKVSEWMVGNVMERLALVGMSPAELEALKSQVRADLIAQNRVALQQVVYDETMLEIVG